MSDSSEGSNAWRVTPEDYARAHPPRFAPPFRLESRYIAVRDGTRLALDVHRPREAAEDERLPTIVIFTPYYRRFKVRAGISAPVEACPNIGLYRDYFVLRGYAVVAVDTRGAGASFGTRDGFRSPVERCDYSDIADWVVAQPWCSGRLGSIGISYVGAAADFFASTGHPAVKAVIPTFAVWDTYSHHQYPGGLQLAKVAAAYNELMDALDRDRRDLLGKYPYFADPNFEGPAPVDDDPDCRLRDQAVAEHAANFDMTTFMARLEFKDSTLSYDPGYSSASISPYHYAEHTNPDVAYYSISGWMDGGGFTNGAIDRFLSLPNRNHRLLIGPWDHGARTNVSPWRGGARSRFPILSECVRFFDRHLKEEDNGLDDEDPVHYFVMGEERWRSASSWPPAGGALTLHAGAGQVLTAQPEPSGEDAYRADFAAGTGSTTRYERLIAMAVEEYYSDWNGRSDRMLTYTTPPLDAALTVIGHPIATLHLTSDQLDGGFFVYLEDVAVDGSARYVTEGVLRALHRKVSQPPPNHRIVGPFHSFRRADAALLEPNEPFELQIALMPTAWRFQAGHRIRIAIACADNDHYARIPDGRPPTIRLLRGGNRASRIELPLG